MKDIIITDEAYKYDGGPLLLLAGPGTGKTWQLAQRIKFLTCDKGIPADEITVVTFTTEAAKGMRTKLEDQGSTEYIEPDKRPSRIFTMHSLGHQIITDNFEAAGLKKGFAVIEDAGIIRPLMRDAAILLGYDENEAFVALQDRITANDNLSEKSKKIIEQYEEILRLCNAIDHDDQISLACKLINKDNETRKKYTPNTKYLLVDEYQDINQSQFELIESLSREYRPGLFVVGDDDQSIYSFRGGNPKFIREFKKHFGKDGVIMQMRTSRRCPNNILECASNIVSDFDPERIPKGDYTFIKSDPGKVMLHDCPSDDREAEIIGAILAKEQRELSACDSCKQLPHKTYFILIPNKNYVSKIKDSLRRRKIPFSSQFGDERKGFLVFELIKFWLSSPTSNFATRQFVELIIECGSIEQLPNSKSRLPEKLAMRKSGLHEIASLWDDVKKEKEPLIVIFQKKSKAVGVIKEIYEKLSSIKDAYDEGELPGFLQKVISCTKPWPSIKKFFDDIEKASPSSTVQGVLNVRIMTSQSSKGLQAHAVFIIGLEEEIIPRKVSTPSALSEEARLLFVGMTRAEDQLHLFKCRKRIGAATYKPIPHNQQPSQFLEHLPDGKYEKKFYPPKSGVKRKKF